MPVSVAVFNADGRLFALEDDCVRCGGSLAAGTLQGLAVTCPECDWTYDITTGCVRNVPSLRTDAFQVKIVDSKVLVASVAGLPERVP